MPTDPRNLAMFIHLSSLLNFVFPSAGYIVPVLIWQLKKDEYPELDAHGKMVTNYLISYFIYSLIAGLLCIVLVGIPILIAIAIVSIIFPIMGGVRANEGELWNYPMTINFIK